MLCLLALRTCEEQFTYKKASMQMNSILEEALNHRAVNHPYLIALRDGSFKRKDRAIHDFAAQYGFYSAWFPRYLTAVISGMENPEHRQHLISNLAEESGHLQEDDLEAIRQIGIKDEWVQGVPHPQLFRRFQSHMGVQGNKEPSIEVEIWRESFFKLVQSESVAESVGAIGLGTESIVKHIYQYIIEAIQNHTNLSQEQYVFFQLHTQVDDEHGLVLLDIAKQMSSKDKKNETDLRKGMLKALNLRAAFWDDMHARALKLDEEDASYAV